MEDTIREQFDYCFDFSFTIDTCKELGAVTIPGDFSLFVELNFSSCQHFQCFGIGIVFNKFDPLLKCLLGVIQQDGNSFLDNDSTSINFLLQIINEHLLNLQLKKNHLDKMHRASCDSDSSLESLSVGMRALEQRQESRVNVDKGAFPLAHKFTSQDSHESGKANNFDSGCTQFFVQFLVEVQTGGKVGVGYDLKFKLSNHFFINDCIPWWEC